MQRLVIFLEVHCCVDRRKLCYLGLNQVQLPTASVLADPLSWLDCLNHYAVQYTWTPNFGLKTVSKAFRAASVGGDGDDRWSAARRPLVWNKLVHCLKLVMNAGEQVTGETIDEFLAVLGGSGPRVVQPAFGMAETCTCMTYNGNYQVGVIRKRGVLRWCRYVGGEQMIMLRGHDVLRCFYLFYQGGGATSSSVFRTANVSYDPSSPMLPLAGGAATSPRAAAHGGPATSTFVDLGPPIPGTEIRITSTAYAVTK